MGYYHTPSAIDVAIVVGVYAVLSFFIYDIVCRPWSGGSVVRQTMVPDSPQFGLFTRGFGIVVPVLEFAFRSARLLSVSHWVQESLTFTLFHSRADRVRWRLTVIDAYVLVTAVLTITLFLISELTSPALTVCIVAYLLLESFVSTVNIVVFDSLRGRPPVASLQRSLILAIVNLLVSIFAFGAIRLALDENFIDIHGGTDAWRDSVRTATFIGVDAASNIGWVIVTSQLFYSVWFLAVMLTWTLGGLPIRLRSDD